jgi:hypothetical protein
MENEEAWDETYVEPKQAHKPTLKDASPHSGKVTGVEVLRDQATWDNETKSFNPDKLHDDLVYTVTLDDADATLTFKVKMSNHEKSDLFRLARDFDFLPQNQDEGITGSKLVGRKIRFNIKHSNPGQDGSIWDNINKATIRPVMPTSLDDLANDPGL